MKHCMTRLYTMLLLRDPASGKILLLDRRGGIGLPGGRVEAGESFVGAAKRWALEAAGLRVEGLGLRGVAHRCGKGGNERDIALIYSPAAFSPTQEGINPGAVLWASPQELRGMKHRCGFSSIIEVSLRDGLSEHFELFDLDATARGLTVLTNMVMIQDAQTGMVVLQDRRKKEWGGITLPGGHVEPGESLIGAAEREAYEETGLRVHDLELRGIAHWCRKNSDARHLVFLYRTTAFAGDLVKDTPEGHVFWGSLEETRGMKLSLNLEEMLAALVREDKSEAFGEWIDDFTAPMVVI